MIQHSNDGMPCKGIGLLLYRASSAACLVRLTYCTNACTCRYVWRWALEHKLEKDMISFDERPNNAQKVGVTTNVSFRSFTGRHARRFRRLAKRASASVSTKHVRRQKPKRVSPSLFSLIELLLSRVRQNHRDKSARAAAGWLRLMKSSYRLSRG